MHLNHGTPGTFGNLREAFPSPVGESARRADNRIEMAM